MPDTLLGKAELHVHTTHSDGIMSVTAALDHIARNTDLRLVAITDHDEIAGALEARAQARAFGLEVIVGEEVSTAEGHLLALFIDRWLPPGRPAAETIAAVHAQGGLCIAAHPFDKLVPSLGRAGLRERCDGPRMGEWPLDALEAFNASSLYRAGPQITRAACAELGLARCGGSDAHSLATIGLGYTTFPGSSADDLYRAIRAGRTEAGGVRWKIRHFLEVGRYRLRGRLRGHKPAPSAEPQLRPERP